MKKTTIELPDDLMREIKVRAAREDRTLKDLVAELLRRGLEQPTPDDKRSQSRIRNRVNLPLIQCAHPAKPGEELTPGRLAEILIEQEADWALGR